MKEDIRLVCDNIEFSCRSCAIIINDNKVLLQKKYGDSYWALPGGKIKYGESSYDAIKRELEEELSIDNIINQKLIDTNEYFFKIDSSQFHQFIFTYIVELSDYRRIDNSIERELIDKTLLFQWFDLDRIDWNTIKPDYLREQIVQGKIKKLNRIIKEG